jgi:hypothetical protein
VYIMERTQIYLTEREQARLRELSEASGKSQSELIRDAIDRVYLDQPSIAERLDLLRASRGAWKARDSEPALRSGRRLALVRKASSDRARQ